MSTLVEQLQALLSPLAAGGAWCMVNTAQPPVYPCIVWQRVASTPNVAMAGGAPSAMQNTRVQIDLYSRSMAELVALQTAVENAMAGWAVANVPVLSQDAFEPDARLFRVILDYSLWSKD